MAVSLPFGKQVNIINWRGDDLPWNSDVGLIQVAQGKYRGGWMKFTRAGAVFSLCAPGRMAAWTGFMPQRHGVLSNNLNGLTLNWNSLYFKDLARRGYTNFVCGKFQNGYGELDENGFTIAQSFPSMGIHKCKIIYGEIGYDGNDFIDETGAIDTTAGTGDAFYYPDLWLSQVTTFLNGVPAGRPWSIYIGDKASHTPVEPPTRYANTSISWTDDPGFGVDPRAGTTKQPQFIIDDADLNWTQNKIDNTRELHLDRLRALRASDDSLKALIDLVESRGELGNTLILLSGDQTDYSGQLRNTGGKGTNHWACNQLNLRVRLPVAGGSANYDDCHALVCDPDIASTIRHACGAVAAYGEDGMSFVPLLNDPGSQFRRSRPFFNFDQRPEVVGLITGGPVTYGYGLSNGRYPNEEYHWVDEHCTINRGKNDELRRETDALLQSFGNP